MEGNRHSYRIQHVWTEAYSGASCLVVSSPIRLSDLLLSVPERVIARVVATFVRSAATEPGAGGLNPHQVTTE